MTWTPPLYPSDYDGYRYTDPTVSGPAVTAESMKTAWDEGFAACRDRPPTGRRPDNPYAGRSQALDEVWRNGYTSADEMRLHSIAEAEDQEQAPSALVAAVFDVSRAPSALKTYWVRGPGAAKIQWGVPGDFDRCRVQIQAAIVKSGRAPLPDREISGLCSNLHVEATGGRPGTE